MMENIHMILMGHGVTKFQKQKNSVCHYGNLGPKNLEFVIYCTNLSFIAHLLSFIAQLSFIAHILGLKKVHYDHRHRLPQSYRNLLLIYSLKVICG